MLLFGSAFMLLNFFYQIYKALNFVSSGSTAQGIGTFVDAGISIFVSIYFFINVRSANKKFDEENATRKKGLNNYE